MNKTEQYLADLRNGKHLTGSMQNALIFSLSMPAILASLSQTVMMVIDESMVGHLGTNASAAIGLISCVTWLMNGIGSGVVCGFSVQTSHAIGAKEFDYARNLSRQGLICSLAAGLLVGVICLFLSPFVPVWMNGENEILRDATLYLGTYAFFLPFAYLNSWSAQTLQATGNTRIPSIVEVCACILDAIMNYILIYPCGLGVFGASLGTAISIVAASLFLTGFILLKDPFLKGRAKARFSRKSVTTAFQLGLPVSVEQVISNSSYLAFTRIISNLGSVGVAAHSLAVTAESLCYMPGYGCGQAASAIIGQCTGAGRKKLSKEFSIRICRIGIGMMSVSGVILFIFAPQLMAMLTPVREVQELGASVLRLEAFAEPMYGASIVVNGILRGKGDTLWPSILNLVSIWFVRIPLAALLVPLMGLKGAWTAMVIELNIRGILFLLRLFSGFRHEKKELSAA